MERIRDELEKSRSGIVQNYKSNKATYLVFDSFESCFMGNLYLIRENIKFDFFVLRVLKVNELRPQEENELRQQLYNGLIKHYDS